MMKIRAFDFALFCYGGQNHWDSICFQQCFSIRSIDLIITKLENHIDTGHIDTTFKFYEAISSYMMKIKAFDFAMFCYGCHQLSGRYSTIES